MKTRVHKAKIAQTEPVSVDKSPSNDDFSQDWRKTNPGLHLLYVKTAVKHLVAIDDMLLKLNDFSNGNMMGAIEALDNERAKLVKTNAAYADADEIIKSIGPFRRYDRLPRTSPSSVMVRCDHAPAQDRWAQHRLPPR